MIKSLRNYQKDAVIKIQNKLTASPHPILVNASVGAGKSLIIATVLLDFERRGLRALCLTLNSTLIQQNTDTYKLQGGQASIYCAALKSKCCKNLIVFASPNSICQSIRNKQEISCKPFHLIIIDECHNVSPHDSNSMYMRIVNHYGSMAQTQQYDFHLIGLTGTPYRGKNESIVGETQLFKEETVTVKMPWLIKNNYLVRPQFGATHVDAIDFSHCHVENTGKFKHKDLELAIHKDERLTGRIMREVSSIVGERFIRNGFGGAFIFAATRQHCLECARSLPDGQWAIITGETPHDERREILYRATNKDIKYLINVNCLTTGIDIPHFDTVAWLRPTESLILYTQGIGRCLRLYAGKSCGLILDYAGNLERHGTIDDELINEALKPTPENEKEYIIPCYTCNTLNTLHARRCIGVINDSRCDHYFQFKECAQCGIKNDITSRQCRQCLTELIDPNARLKEKTQTFELNVIKTKYFLMSPNGIKKNPIVCAEYITNQGIVFENHSTSTVKSQNILYAKFIRVHIKQNPSSFYPFMNNWDTMQRMIRSAQVPHQLICKKNERNKYEIIKKLF